MIIAISIFCLAFIALAWKKLDWAVLVLLFLLPSYLIRFQVAGLPMTLLEAMILIVFLIFLIKNFKSLTARVRANLKARKIQVRYPWDLEIIILLIISLIAVAIAGWSNSALGIWKAYFFEPILLFLVIVNIFQDKKAFGKIIWTLAWSALAVSLFGFFQYFTGLYITNPFWAAEATRRITSVFEYPNAVGLYLAPIIILSFGWLLDKIKEKKIDFWPTIGMSFIIVLSLFAVFFAQSEGALVGLLISFVIIGLLSKKKIAWATFGLIVILVIVITSIAPIRNYTVQKITMNDLSGQIRKLQWKETLKMMRADKEKIIFGTGLASYQQSILPFHQEGFFYNFDHDPDFKQKIIESAEYRATHWQPVEIYLYPHNIFLNFWTEIGLLGLLLFVWLLIKYFVRVGKLIYKDKEDKYFVLGLGGAILTMMIHGWVDVPYFKNDLSVLFWVIFAMLGMVYTKKKAVQK